MKAWYLVYCKPRNEVRAQLNLTMQGLETYLPKHRRQVKGKDGKISVVESPLFPNYLFLQFDPTVTSVRSIHSTRGVCRIVGCREDMTALDDGMIRALKRREQQLEKLPEHVALVAGERVKFTEGPFSGLEAVFLEADGDKRCIVLFQFMGQQKQVATPSDSISRICA
ncbi:transcription/translation regulatory transformer protein RfaH [Shewanella sp. JM162201]|uniref:Transcription antitermination protein RfaH n=1 Tax=Shewanella jiangmenensis TaxID=2837387 RepID=A0ABS5UY57_9GAMM|nr:transcription/translation regulatory transformer protein RfaH [Shewanella jiangmenensis]MBT1443016.1 transcription/translation regulatory transformer protein RfaH [Shewanella jiangmenensis]